MVDEESLKAAEIPKTKLYPTAYLNNELRQYLDDFLEISWLEDIDIIRKNNPDEAEIVERFLEAFILNLDGYNALNTLQLRQPKDANQDSFLQEWVGQIKNLMMRTNVIRGQKMYDFSGYGETNNLEEKTQAELTLLHMKVAHEFFTTLAKTDETGGPTYNSRDLFDWWGQKSLTQILTSAAQHETGHAFLMQPTLIKLRKVPPLYHWAPQLISQNQK